MFKRISHKLKTINPWHFLWIAVLFSEVFGLLFITVQSYLWWGFLSRDLLVMGLIDCLFVPLLVAPVVIYFVRHTAKLKELNKELQLEVIKIKQSEEKALRESEARYRSIVEDQTEFINRFQPDGTITFVNESCCRYFQKKYDEFVGSNFMPLLPEDDREKLRKLLHSLNIENPVGTIEHRVITPEGEIGWQKWTNRAIFDENGNIAEFQAVGSNITERKRIEQALTDSEQLYRDLFENAPVGLSIADKNGNLIAFNDAMLVPGGYTREDIEKIRNVSELYYDREERDKVLSIARQQGFLHRHRVQFKRKDGTPYDALLSLRFIMYQGSPCLQAMVEDITERQKIQDALQKSEKRYRELFEDSPISLVETDLSAAKKYIDDLKDSGLRDFRTYFTENREALRQCRALTKIVDLNNETLELFKAATKQEFMENFRHTFHEESNVFFIEDAVALAEGRKSHEHESVARTFAGDKINILFKWFVASGYEETLSKVYASFIDITGQKQTEEDRDRIFNMSYDLICVAGTDGYFKFLNLAWERMLGYTREELLSRPFLDFIHPDDHHKNDEEVARLAAGHVTVDFENRYIHKDGSVRTLSWSAMPLPEKGLMYCIGRDITKRKQDEQLIRSYQDQLSLMASRLSLIEEKERRKIALELHDNIGQILALARLKLGEIRKTNEAGFEDSVEEVRSLLEKSIKYTRALTFELSTPMLYEIGLEPALRWLGEEFQRKYGITFSVIEDRNNGPLPEDMRVILFQCIRELMTNVVKHAQAHNVRISIERKDHSIQIAVEDDGTGFDIGSSDGRPMKSGFGLFSVRDRLKNIGGNLDIKSAPVSGTRITLTVPLNTSRE